MPITVHINGIDQSPGMANGIEFRESIVQNNLYSNTDTYDFVYIKHGTKTYKPQGQDEVEIWDNAGTKIFGGRIVRIRSKVMTPEAISGGVGGVVRYEISCKGYVEDMDRRMVFGTFEDMTVNEIIADIVANFCPEFTTINVACVVNVKRAQFNGKPPSKCIDELAELVGYFWYIDTNRDIHFFTRGTEVAPFDLTDISKNYDFKTLEIEDDWLSLINILDIRGGTFVGSSIVTQTIKVMETDILDRDGNYVEPRTEWDTKSRFAEKPKISLNDVEITVGTLHEDDPDDYDVLWGFDERIVKFRKDNRPGLFDTIKVEGNELLPVIFRATDPASYYSYGAREKVIVDKSLLNISAATQMAATMLDTWKDKIINGSFITYTSGLRAGQQINYNSAIRGEGYAFMIKTVIYRTVAPVAGKDFVYEVELITQRVVDLIDILAKQVLEEDKKLELPRGEIITKFIQIDESIAITEHTVITLGGIGLEPYYDSYGPYWVAGPYQSPNYAYWPYNFFFVPIAGSYCYCHT